MQANELKTNLRFFTGSESIHYDPLNRWLKYTDGVKFFLQNAGGGAYWLHSLIAADFRRQFARGDNFTVITVTSKNDKARVVATDGDGNKLKARNIEFTDLPEGEWQFYIEHNGSDFVMLLPSEH